MPSIPVIPYQKPEGRPNPIDFAKGFASKLWEGIKNIGVNQDYPGVERDLQGNEIIELPTGERFNKELWERPGFQEEFYRNLRNQSGQQGEATGQQLDMPMYVDQAMQKENTDLRRGLATPRGIIRY